MTALLAALVAGCSTAGSAAAERESRDWQEFGPFAAPHVDEDAPGLEGPTQLRLPDGEIAHFNAVTLLGSGVTLPEKDDYTVLSQTYSYTMDGSAPIIVALVQTAQAVHYRGYSEKEYVTFVLGVSAEPEPRELTRTQVLRGGEHSTEFAGQSDLGVVAIFLNGELTEDDPSDTRVIGVDAVRGTQVWSKEHGYPGYGETTATFYLSPSKDACATEVEVYTVANGIPKETKTYSPEDQDEPGGCHTAAGSSIG